MYNVKMRASKKEGEKDKHISGAEKIVCEKDIPECTKNLVKRALYHANGVPDFINIKTEKINPENTVYLNALNVKTIEAKTPEEGLSEIKKCIEACGIKNIDKIIEIFRQSKTIRGAILLDTDTLKRLESNSERGIRATCMDGDKYGDNSDKNHFQEALILATKVANAPGIIGEICVSDDINYQTGYFASKKTGYVRITNLKEKGDTFGGRIFLYKGDVKDVKKTVDFLENTCAIIKGTENIRHDKKDFIRKELANIREKNLLRTLLKIDFPIQTKVKINNKKIHMFASNDYLNFSNNETIKKYSAKAAKKFGTATGGSRLICGNSPLHEELEEKLAKFKNKESAILFNSGYTANTAALSGILKEGDVIFSDELNHASIIDGCRLSKARTVVYKHNDMCDLEEKINQNSFKNAIVASDSVFSMTGDILNLPEFVRITEKYNILSYIDEAHATGVIGTKGHGTTEYFNLKKSPDIIMGTLSKAIGSIGGFICADREIIDFLRNKARGFIFSTSLPPAVIASSLKGLEILENNPEVVKKLHGNIDFFNSCLAKYEIKAYSDTAIFSILIGDEAHATNISKKLYASGFFVGAVRYPTVEKNRAILRIAINAEHKKTDLEALAKKIFEVTK